MVLPVGRRRNQIGGADGPAGQQEGRALRPSFPLAPVRGSDVDLLPSFCVNPLGVDPATGESERVRAIFVNNRQFKVAIGRRRGDILPLHDR